MPLSQAATYVHEDQTYFGKSRRRRSIAKLAGYGLGRDDVDDALKLLGAKVSYLHAELDRYRRPAGDAPVPSSAIESIAYDLEPYQQLETENCPTKKLEVFVPDNGLPAAMGAARISVERDLGAVARALDPQSWDVCSKFFKPPERTYLSKPNGTPDSGQTPGMPYGPSLLFEFYTCPVTDGNGNPTGCNAWFKNFLNVLTWWSSTSKTYNVRYSLDHFFQGDIQNTGNAELTIDEGGAEADADAATGQVVASGWKTLAFKNLAATAMTKALLTVMVDEVTGELAELACCPVPQPGS